MVVGKARLISAAKCFLCPWCRSNLVHFAGLSAESEQRCAQVWSVDHSQLNPLLYCIRFGRNSLSEALWSPPGQKLRTTDQSRTDTVRRLPRRPGGRKLLTCQQALGEVREAFTGS